MGLEGAGEGSYESGRSSDTSGRNDGDGYRGSERGTVTDVYRGSERGSVTDLSESRFAQGSYEAPAGMGDTGAKYGTGAVGTFTETKTTGIFKGIVAGLVTAATKGPIAGIMTAKEQIKTTTTERNLSEVFADPHGHMTERGNEGNSEPYYFFNHSLDAVLTSESNNNLANKLQPEVSPDPYINFNSLGYSGDASRVSPGSNLAVTKQDNSGLLVALAAAAAVIL